MTQFQGPLVAVFDHRDHAREAIHELRDAGFGDEQIGMLTPDGRIESDAEPGEETKWAEGALTGGVAGAGIGGLWALGISAGVLPIVGPVIAGGILASVLASAAGGAAVGGIVGGLIGLGISEADAEYYEREFHGGRTIVTVSTGNRGGEVREILRRHGGEVRDDSRPMTPPPLPRDSLPQAAPSPMGRTGPY